MCAWYEQVAAGSCLTFRPTGRAGSCFLVGEQRRGAPVTSNVGGQIGVTSDEQMIRDVIARWHRATAAGDIDTVLSLMADDAVFFAAGKSPMRGRSTFAKALRTVLASHSIESTGEIQEVEVSGSLAYCWTLLTVRISPRSAGATSERTGSSLSIFRKRADGSWVLVRDANLLPSAA